MRKHIDQCHDIWTESALAAFRQTLIAMGECGARAVPGTDLYRNLEGIQNTLSTSTTPELLSVAASEVNRELTEWADEAFRHHEDNERELREIMGAVASAAFSVGDRDERFAREIGELAGKLSGLSNINDLATIRRSIMDNTSALKACVEKMAEENRKSVGRLTTQVAEYRCRLEKSERESAIDSLTQLANRRAFEHRLESQIAENRPFCLILMDMDNFKAVNDRYGHVAGDDLLRQFAMELKAQFRPADLVARWGGDEFAVVAAGNYALAQAGIDRIRRWAVGEYKIDTGDNTVRIYAGASVAAVEWGAGESANDLVARVDKCVYREKSAVKAVR